MERTLFEPIEQHSSTISISCSSVQKTTLGVHCKLRTAGSCLDRSKWLANWSLSSFCFNFWRKFLTCFISLGISAMTSQCKIPPVFSTDSSKILEGPLWLFAFSWIAFLVDCAVGTKLLPERGFLYGLNECSVPVKWYSTRPSCNSSSVWSELSHERSVNIVFSMLARYSD